MLMGTAEDKVIKPITTKTIFIEDLNPEERARLLKEKTGVLNIINCLINFFHYDRKYCHMV